MLVDQSDFDSAGLRRRGFSGFVSIAGLRRSRLAEVPPQPGVYVVLAPTGLTPDFLPTGTGGWFKSKDPNVATDVLARRWIPDAQILNIGKAGGGNRSHLRRRLQQYLEFGAGVPLGHWGGRYIWQLKQAEDLEVCWMTIESNPREFERELIAEFVDVHGVRPFANLRG